MGAAVAVAAAALIIGLAFQRRRGRPRASPTSSSSSSSSPSLCIASCSELIEAAGGMTAHYGLTGADEDALYAALRRCGVAFDVRAWDDKRVDWGAYEAIAVRTTWDYSQSEAKAYQFRRWLARISDLGVPCFNHPRWVVAGGREREGAREGERGTRGEGDMGGKTGQDEKQPACSALDPVPAPHRAFTHSTHPVRPPFPPPVSLPRAASSRGTSTRTI
jgi:hypothetical protein